MSDTPRTDTEWNNMEPQCADASVLAEVMYEKAQEIVRELNEANAVIAKLRAAVEAQEELNKVGLLFAEESLLRKVSETHKEAVAWLRGGAQ